MASDKNEVRIVLRGGLGNQLFQLALGISLAKANNTKVLFSEMMLGSAFRETPPRANWAAFLALKTHVETNRTREIFLRLLFSASFLIANKFSRQMQLGTFLLSSPHGWRGQVSELNFTWLDIPSFHPSEQDEVYKAMTSLLDSRRPNSVNEVADNLGDFIGIHIRVGDYVALKDTYGSISSSFVSEALSVARESTKPGAPLILFCENPEQLASDVIMALGDYKLASDLTSSDWEEFQLLRAATTLIGCNSSFSWWAAKTSEAASVIFPRELLGPQFDLPQYHHDPGWLRVAN